MTTADVDAESAALAHERARLDRLDRQDAAILAHREAELRRFRRERAGDIDEARARFVHAVRTGPGWEWLTAWRDYRVTRSVVETERQRLEAGVAEARGEPRRDAPADIRQGESFDNAVAEVLDALALEEVIREAVKIRAVEQQIRSAVE
jgi:hypothetical protein